MSPATTESARWRRYLGAGGWGVILTVLTISLKSVPDDIAQRLPEAGRGEPDRCGPLRPQSKRVRRAATCALRIRRGILTYVKSPRREILTYVKSSGR